jgi:hypothetical protein
VAGIDKLIELDPAIYRTQAAFDTALAHVMNYQGFDAKDARVISYMHSEGAIHGGQVLNDYSANQLLKIHGYTLGAGTYLFDKEVIVDHFGTTNNWGMRDPVPLLAAMDIVRNSSDITWVPVDQIYTHGVSTYFGAVMVDIAKNYFAQNVDTILSLGASSFTNFDLGPLSLTNFAINDSSFGLGLGIDFLTSGSGIANDFAFDAGFNLGIDLTSLSGYDAGIGSDLSLDVPFSSLPGYGSSFGLNLGGGQSASFIDRNRYNSGISRGAIGRSIYTGRTSVPQPVDMIKRMFR